MINAEQELELLRTQKLLREIIDLVHKMDVGKVTSHLLPEKSYNIDSSQWDNLQTLIAREVPKL